MNTRKHRTKKRITKERFGQLVAQGWAATWNAFEPPLVTVHREEDEKCTLENSIAFVQAEDDLPKEEWEYYEFQ